MRILAIDPGLNGGIAWQFQDEISARPMPANDAGLDLRLIIRDYFEDILPNLIVVERVQNLRGEDGAGDRTRVMGASSMFKFGQGFGELQGIAAYWKYFNPETVIAYPTPQQWKRVILPGRTKGKQGAIDYCKVQFPQVGLVLPGCRKPHDGMADALCLLRYGQKLAERI